MPVQSGTVRYSCIITTVDPSATTVAGDPAPIVEAVIKSGKAIQVSLYNIPPAFRWPVVGETWMVIQYNGSWYLDGIFPGTSSANRYTDYDQGDLTLNSQTGKVAVIGTTPSDTEENSDFELFYDTTNSNLSYSHDKTIYGIATTESLGSLSSTINQTITSIQDELSSSELTYSGNITASITAGAGELISANSAGLTVTLPSSPTDGDVVGVINVHGTRTQPTVINSGSIWIKGVGSNNVYSITLVTTNAFAVLKYSSAVGAWCVIARDGWGTLEPYATSAYYNGSPLIPNLGEIVPLNTVEYVSGAAQTSDWVSLNSANTAWVCPVAGIYSFKGAIGMTTFGGAFRAISQLYKNGGIVRRCFDGAMTSGDSNPVLPLQGDISCAGGDRIQPFIYVSAANAATFSGNSFDTYLTICRVA